MKKKRKGRIETITIYMQEEEAGYPNHVQNDVILVFYYYYYYYYECFT